MSHSRRQSSSTETTEVSPFNQGVTSAHRRHPSSATLSIRPPPVVGAGTAAGYRSVAQEDAGPLSPFKSSSFPRYAWLKVLRILIPTLGLAAFIIAGMEKASIISLEASLEAMRNTLTLRTPERVIEYIRPRPYFCPLASAPRPSTPFTSEELSAFLPLDSQIPEFTMSLAYSQSACNQFRVKITRTDKSICHQARNQRVSDDPAIQKHITENLGPDTFQLRVDGAERLVVDVPERYDSHDCSYDFDFRLSTPGTVWFFAKRLYKEYDGFYELHANQSDHINPTINYFLPRPLQLNLCESTCSPYQTPLLSAEPYVFDFRHPRQPITEAKAMPACTGADPIPGAYVASSLPSILYPPVRLPMTESRPTAGLYDFVPTGCTFQHDGLRFRNHDSCFEKKGGILFIGDSHARAAYDALLHRLSGNDTVVQFSQKIPTKSAELGNLHLEFLWDPFLTSTVDCEAMKHLTSVVVSTGAHQACWACERTPTSALAEQLETLFAGWSNDWAKCLAPGATPPKLIYMNSPAFEYPASHYRLDCRTGPRMQHWNGVAGRLARESGWSVVDTFAHSRPFAVDTLLLDGVHYLKTDAIDPMADEIIEKLGICGNNPDLLREASEDALRR